MGSDSKIYYSMGEVAGLLDVNPSLLRFWEGKFPQLKPHKNAKGNRLFTPQDVDNLKLIYHLVKERGMTLRGAQKVLRGEREGVEGSARLLERLQTIRSLLLEIKHELGDRAGEVFVDAGLSQEIENQKIEMSVAALEPSAPPFDLPSDPAPTKSAEPRIVEQTLF